MVFVLAMFVPKAFLSVAFDSGGVTTGPMTVPFIMALGVGISATRSDRHAADDSFGLVALCSIGPILAVMILSMIFKADSSAYTPPVIPEIGDSKDKQQRRKCHGEQHSHQCHNKKCADSACYGQDQRHVRHSRNLIRQNLKIRLRDRNDEA